MNQTPDQDELELENIYDRVEELFDELTPEEIEAEARANGENPEEIASEVRSIFAKAYKKHTQQLLWESQSAYKREAEILMNVGDDDLPHTLDEQIALLTVVQAAQPQLLESFTMKYRDFQSLSQADRNSLLRQLKALGVLDDIQKKDSETHLE